MFDPNDLLTALVPDPLKGRPPSAPEIEGCAGCAQPVAGPWIPTTLSWWLLYVPGFHAAWNCYSLSLCHLRPAPDLPEPMRYYPEAEFELLLTALSPEQDPDADDHESLQPLNPVNLVYHFHGVSDPIATTLARQLVGEVCMGRLHPEPPLGYESFRRQWEERLQHLLRSLGAPVPPDQWTAEAIGRRNETQS